MSFLWASTSPPTSNFVEVEVLIQEARQRQKRRHRLIAGALLAVGVSIGALVAAIGGNANHIPTTSQSHSRGPSSGRTSTHHVRAAGGAVNPEPGFTVLKVIRGRLYAMEPSIPQVGCVASPVNMTTLAIESKIAVGCPQSFNAGYSSGYRASTAGKAVSPVVSLDLNLMHGPNSYDGLVQIVRKDPETGQSVTGPVVFTFDDEVNTYQIEYAYGAGILWIYDCNTPEGSKMIEVSATTGLVERTLAMPNVCRAAIAANANGFFLWQDTESFGPRQNVMYHVAPNAAQVVAVEPLSSRLIWSKTIGSSLWVLTGAGSGVLAPNQTHELLRFVGVQASPQVIAPDVGVGEFQLGPIPGAGARWVVLVMPKGKHPMTYVQSVAGINTTTGRTETFGSFGNDLLEPGAGNASIVYLDRSVFALEGGRIYRIHV